MKNKTENIIESLVSDNSVKNRYSPLKILLKWVLLSAAYIFILLEFLGYRADLNILIKDPNYLIELSSLVLMIFFSALAFSYLAVPDYKQNAFSIIAPVIPVGFLIGTLIFLYFYPPSLNHDSHEGMMCLACISLSSLLPAAFLFYEIRKYAAPTKLGLIGYMCLLYSASLGSFALRLSEPTNSIIHLIMYHYLPLFVIAGVGSIISRKLLRW